MTGQRENPMLSVVVPVYNTSRYLEKMLDSTLASTFRDFELILVDDGSTDDSPAICDRYRDEHPEFRIRVFHRENRGASAARNFGLSQATGKYVTWCDSDDWMEPELFETLISAAEKAGAQIAVCDIRYYDEQTGKFEHFKDSLFPQSLAGRVFDFRSCGTIIKGLLDCATWNKVFLRSLIVDNGIQFPDGFGEDNRFWAEAFFAAERMVVAASGELYNYRINQKRQTVCVTAKKGYFGFAFALGYIKDVMVRRGAFEEFAGEYIAHITMQFIVAYCMVARERRGDFYREFAQLASKCGGYRPSRELGAGMRWCVAYTYWTLRHLPYWCGAVALLPLIALKNPTLKKIIRKLSGKN